MNKQFTASEVLHKLRERFTSGNSVPVPDVRLTRAEFDALADLLEAQEKAVPVGCLTVQRFRGSDAMVNHDFDYYGSLPDGSYSLYTQSQSAPSDAEKRETMTPREFAKRIERGEKWKLADEPAPCQSQNAERLAEALRSISNDANDTGDKFGNPDECIESIARTAEKALAAHSAPAQPPAANVTDAKEWRERIEAAAYILYLQDWCQNEECPVDFTEAFLRSLREKWINGWLPARFEEHCGDCTKVAAPCTRCGIERYFSDAARLLGAPKAALEAALAAQENPNG